MTSRARLQASSCAALCAAALLLASLSVAACGKGASSATAGSAKGIAGAGVAASSVAVIKGWADALREGHARRAAAYWALPSDMVNGPDTSGHLTLIHIDSEHDALLADESLSCGATLHATARSGRYVRATFLLSLRSGAGASKSGCSGAASVDFLISGGHIVRWLRAPVAGGATPPPSGEPGEPGGGAGAQSI